MVRVTSNGWHTAIIVERSQLAAAAVLAEAKDFPDATFLEFGWGDSAYYPARTKTIDITLAAAFTPTPSVMHMAELARPPEAIYAEAEIVAVRLTRGGFDRLIGAIATSFARPADGPAVPISRGLYPNSYFYDAIGSFHIFNTCNTWTARMLRAGGVDISPSGVATADELMARLRDAITKARLPTATH